MVWQNSEVGQFVAGKFVSLRVTVTDKDYKQYRKDFSVRGTPTVLFLDDQGKEIDRLVGFDGKKDEYFQTLKDYAAGKNTLTALLPQIEKSPEDVDLNYKMAQKYLDRYELDKAQPYFEKVLELDPEDQKGYGIEATYQIALNEARTNKNIEPLKAFIATQLEEKYLVTAYSTLAFHHQRQRENDQMVATYEEALAKLPENPRLMLSFASSIFLNKIESQYEKGLALNEKAKELDPELELSTYYNMVQYYQNIKDSEKLVETFEEAIQKWPDNTGLKSYFAGTIFRNRIESQYDRGIALGEEIVETIPQAGYYWYTLGQLYQAKGVQDKAAAALKKALELDPENKTFQSALDKARKKDENEE